MVGDLQLSMTDMCKQDRRLWRWRRQQRRRRIKGTTSGAMDASHLLRHWRSVVLVASVKFLRCTKYQTINAELDGTQQLQQQPLSYYLGYVTIGLLRQRLKGTARP
jgi:hypothetical protein